MNFKLYYSLVLFVIASSLIAQENSTELDFDYRDLMDSDKGTPSSLNELIGAWKVIKLPNNLNKEATLESNKTIYYYFNKDGIYRKFLTDNDKNFTYKDIENLARNKTDTQFWKYTLVNGILTIYFPEVRKSNLNILNKNYGISRKGDLFISPQFSKYSPMNFELLRKME